MLFFRFTKKKYQLTIAINKGIRLRNMAPSKKVKSPIENITKRKIVAIVVKKASPKLIPAKDLALFLSIVLSNLIQSGHIPLKLEY
ncbi:MAG: hypothetical protein BAJALOKI2v1_420004 [Promethearchaeota archaeon]|nr:MAG: hypothetical protein BAJALOKI2v1_420004 [Candidatus Lokiarchaeota archaeon]